MSLIRVQCLGVLVIILMNFKTLEDIENVGQVTANTVIHGDCLEAMKYIADKSVDMVLCDLPYG